MFRFRFFISHLLFCCCFALSCFCPPPPPSLFLFFDAQVKEVRSASAALSKQKSALTRAARARGQPTPNEGGLARRLVCMEKLSEVCQMTWLGYTSMHQSDIYLSNMHQSYVYLSNMHQSNVYLSVNKLTN